MTIASALSADIVDQINARIGTILAFSGNDRADDDLPMPRILVMTESDTESNLWNVDVWGVTVTITAMSDMAEADNGIEDGAWAAADIIGRITQTTLARTVFFGIASRAESESISDEVRERVVTIKGFAALR